MRLPEFEYVEPKTLREATKLLSSGPKGSALLAGGTDLLVSMKHQVLRPRRVANLRLCLDSPILQTKRTD